jgi:hypothetical protein
MFWAAAGRVRQAPLDLVKLKASIYYIKTVQALRGGVLVSAAAAGAMILFALGVLFLEVTVVFLIPWSPGARMAAGLTVAVADLSAAAVLLYALLSSENWMKISGASRLVRSAFKREEPEEE